MSGRTSSSALPHPHGRTPPPPPKNGGAGLDNVGDLTQSLRSVTRASLYKTTGGKSNQTFEFVNPLLKLGISHEKNDRMNKIGGAKQIKDFLASVATFADFDAQQLHKLEASAVIRSYQEGQIIFLQGEVGAEFFVIHTGSVDILIQEDKSQLPGLRQTKDYGKVVNRLNEGSFFGERALMTFEPRAATIRASTNAVCYVFSRRIYEDVISGAVGTTFEAALDLSKDHETRSLFKHITTILDIQRMTSVSQEVRRTFYALTTTFTPELSADQVIARMVMIVKAAVSADRVGLFLLSEDKKMMVLKMSEISKGIRLPIKGLAGAVLSLNEVLNIPDAYTDERFDTTMDKRTSYRTHQVLGVPVRNPVTGEAVGVVQVNNRTDVENGAFTDQHVAILQLAANQFEELLHGRMDVFLNSDFWVLNGVCVSHSSEIDRPFKV